MLLRRLANRASGPSEEQLRTGRSRLWGEVRNAAGERRIKPHARTNDDSGCPRIRVPALRGKEDVDLTSNIKIVCSARKAGINHRSTGRCEWAGAIRHDRDARDRSRSGRRIVKVEDPHGQTEFGRQLLDRPGTPTGQHRVQTTSPRLRSHKMPRIAVGAVNHPLGAAGHSCQFYLLSTALCASSRVSTLAATTAASAVLWQLLNIRS